MSVVRQNGAGKTDPARLILAIKEHPELWNSWCPKYKVMKAKERAWNQIASEIVDGWKNFSRSEKVITLRFLIKRWNNIRDYYVKSLKARRQKKYAFADQLAFLHPELQRKLHFQESLDQIEDFKIEILDEEDEEEESREELEEEHVQEEYVTFVDSLDHNYDDSNHSTKQTLQYSPEREEDPDLMFLKSLLPDMKKLSDEEKFTFKYSIMQAYMDILNKRNT